MKPMTEEEIELLTERLVERIQKANTYILENIGELIKKLRGLRPTEAQQLQQILLYGEDYQEIVNKISKLTGLTIKEIDEIFLNYAEKDQSFYKDFYKYRNIPFVELAQNEALKSETLALAKATKNELLKFMRPKVLGYTIRGLDGEVKFMGLAETYNRVLDEAVLTVGQGKETFNQAMEKIMRDIGGSGLKTLDLESGRSIRLDSMVRQHLQSALREVHNANQEIIGEEIGFDGWEISVHTNPAPDHAMAQGRRFKIEEFKKLQKDGVAKDVNGNEINMHNEKKDGDDTTYFRPISEYNCYHVAFSVVLDATEPLYSEEELNKIIKDNEKGFEYEGKKYTMYEGTQLQRKIETEIRKQKDTHILAKKSGDMDLVGICEKKIDMLLSKYKEISDISGLPTKLERLKVADYRRTKKI